MTSAGGVTHSARRCCPPGWRAATVPACGAQPGCIPGTRRPSLSAAGPGAGSDCRGGSGRLQTAQRGTGGQKTRRKEEHRQKENVTSGFYLRRRDRVIPHTAGTEHQSEEGNGDCDRGFFSSCVHAFPTFSVKKAPVQKGTTAETRKMASNSAIARFSDTLNIPRGFTVFTGTQVKTEQQIMLVPLCSVGTESRSCD